jgi:hypothetical protein
MNPKTYMEEAERLRRRISRKENELISLRATADGMTGMGNSDMPKTVSPDPHKMEATICRIIMLEGEIRDIRSELDDLVKKMRSEIEQVQDSDYRDVLTKRYLEFKPWRTIAVEMFISERQAYYIHREALSLLD